MPTTPTTTADRAFGSHRCKRRAHELRLSRSSTEAASAGVAAAVAPAVGTTTAVPVTQPVRGGRRRRPPGRRWHPSARPSSSPATSMVLGRSGSPCPPRRAGDLLVLTVINGSLNDWTHSVTGVSGWRRKRVVQGFVALLRRLRRPCPADLVRHGQRRRPVSSEVTWNGRIQQRRHCRPGAQCRDRPHVVFGGRRLLERPVPRPGRPDQRRSLRRRGAGLGRRRRPAPTPGWFTPSPTRTSSLPWPPA